MLLRKNYFSVIVGILSMFSATVYAVESGHEAMIDDEGHVGMTDHDTNSDRQSPVRKEGQHGEGHALMKHDHMSVDAGHVKDAGDHHDELSQEHAGISHNHNGTDSHDEKSILSRLDSIPASGKSREAGFDGRYVMEPTGQDDSSLSQCLKADRGLVMIDSVTKLKCAGKASGQSMEVTGESAKMDHGAHSQH